MTFRPGLGLRLAEDVVVDVGSFEDGTDRTVDAQKPKRKWEETEPVDPGRYPRYPAAGGAGGAPGAVRWR